MLSQGQGGWVNTGRSGNLDMGARKARTSGGRRSWDGGAEEFRRESAVGSRSRRQLRSRPTLFHVDRILLAQPRASALPRSRAPVSPKEMSSLSMYIRFVVWTKLEVDETFCTTLKFFEIALTY